MNASNVRNKVGKKGSDSYELLAQVRANCQFFFLKNQRLHPKPTIEFAKHNIELMDKALTKRP